MITIPSVLEIEGVTVFPDDEDCNLFYLIPSTPQIRLGEDGTPIFSGLFWTDKADGQSPSTAGLAGGWINFDVNLAVDEVQTEKILQALRSSGVQEQRRKQLIRQENERLSLIARAKGSSAIPEPDVPPVGPIRFGSVGYKEGKVTLLEESGGDLVAWSSAGGPASLIGDNNAAFALRLSADGAAIWYKSLKEDAKAISVVYDLTFPMRLPSLEIRAWAGSSQELEIHRKAERVWHNVDQGCSDADVERINVKEITSKLMEEGLVNIEIKKGSSEISDVHVSQLRTMMIDLISEKIKEIIRSRIHGMTEDERRNSLIELIKEEVHSFVELRFSQRDVVEWKVAPQATIMGFLEDIPEARKHHITKLVDLADPVVQTLEIPVSVNAPWEEAPFVEAVKVTCRYPSAPDQQYSNVFRQGENTDVWRFRRPKKDDGRIVYTAEVHFKGRSETLVLEEKETNGALNIQVGKVGLVNLNFRPHPVLSGLAGDNKITAVEVAATYKGETDEDHFATAVVFTPEEVEGKRLEHFTGRPVDAPLEYQVRYFTRGAGAIEMPRQKYYLTENQTAEIFTPNPFEDTLEIGVELPFLPDESLRKVIVELEYQDEANNFASNNRVVLSADDDWEPVIADLVQMDKSKNDFRYRYKLLGNNGIGRSPWIAASGDQSLVLPILPVMIDLSRLGLGGQTTNAILELRYDDPANDHYVADQLFFGPGDGSRRTYWFVPRVDASLDSFTYNLILFDAGGAMREFRDQTGRGRFLILAVPQTV